MKLPAYAAEEHEPLERPGQTRITVVDAGQRRPVGVGPGELTVDDPKGLVADREEQVLDTEKADDPVEEGNIATVASTRT